MQFSTIANLMLSLSAGTQALPATPNVPIDQIPTSINVKRDDVAKQALASIASFANEDCKGAPENPPLLEKDKLSTDGCIPFTAKSDTIGINWGTSSTPANKLQAFTDDKCQKKVTEINYSDNPKGVHGIGMDACVSQGAKGGPWGSVLFVDTLPKLQCIITPSGCFQQDQ